MIRRMSEGVWVRFAHARGKWCKKGKYFPIRMELEGITLVRFSFPMSESTLRKLMHRWGFSEITEDEREELLKNVTPVTAPFLFPEVADEYPSVVFVLFLFSSPALLVHLVECVIAWMST